MTESLTAIPKDVTELINKWIGNTEAYSEAHMSDSIALKRRHRLIGVPSAVLGAIVGTTIFTSIQDAADSNELRWFLAGLSMLSATLAALVTNTKCIKYFKNISL